MSEKYTAPPVPAEAEPTPELSVDMNREQLLGYFGSQVDRISSVSDALGGNKYEWAVSDGFFQSGTALNSMIDRVSANPNYTPSEVDILVAKYIDADIKETTAIHSIDDDKLAVHYGIDASNKEALFAHIDAIQKDLSKHNDKIAIKLAEYPKAIDPEKPDELDYLSERSTKRLTGNRRANFRVIGDVSRAHQAFELKNGNGMNPAALIELADKHKSGEVDPAIYEQAKKELADNIDVLDRAADAYMLVVGDKEHDFKDKDFIEELDLVDDEKRLEVIEKQQKAKERSTKPIDIKTEREEKEAEARKATKPTPKDKGATPPVVRPETAPKDSDVDADKEADEDDSSESADPADTPESSDDKPKKAKKEAKAKDSPERTEADTKAARRALQQIRVENAAAALHASSLNRSSHLFANGEADDYGKTLHANFGKEVYELMQFDRPKILDDPSVTQKEKNAFISKYAFDEYHKVAMATVESMGGEKDPKKRKRNARLLRLGGAGLGFLLGGPAGMVVGGSIGFGLSKGLDSEMKNREKLKNALQRFQAQDAADNYLNTLDRDGEAYNEKDAFFAATANLMGTFEHGLVNGRRRNIGKAILQGTAWTVGTMVVAHEAAAAMQYVGDQAYHAVAKASWSGTGVPWDGGVNPNFNYTMHEKPVSVKVLSGLFGAANPFAGATVGAAILAGLGGIKVMQDGPDAKKKKKNNDRTRANAA